MTTQTTADTLRPVDALDALIARHGLMRIAVALAAALLKRRRGTRVASHALSPHLQRDIGMAEDRSRYWEMR